MTDSKFLSMLAYFSPGNGDFDKGLSGSHACYGERGEEEKYENIDRETHFVVAIIKSSQTHVTDNKFLNMLTYITRYSK